MKLLRIGAILQLIIAFLVLSVWASKPFLYDLYREREILFIGKTIKGDPSLLSRIDENEIETVKKILKKNEGYFSSLQLSEKESIQQAMTEAEKEISRPFIKKLYASVETLFINPPLFLQLLMILSIVVAIAILKERPWVKWGVWILPSISLLAIFQIALVHPRTPSHRERLYPQAFELQQEFPQFFPLNTPLKLQHSFNAYLITHYLKEPLPEEPLLFQEKEIEGKFYFNIALLHAILQDEKENIPSMGPSLFLFFWNLIFATITLKRMSPHGKKNRQLSMDSTRHPL